MAIEIIRECARMARAQRAAIGRLKTARVTREKTKEAVRGLVDGYFRTDRPLIVQELGDPALVAGLDAAMQELLSLAQSRSLKSRYSEVLGRIASEWDALERVGMPLARPMIGLPARTPRQELILRSLSTSCEPAARCFDQALRDLGDDQRCSWRGTVSELREALRTLLDQLAPDEAVVKSAGFRLEEGARGPTMKQKTRFVLRSKGLSDSDREPVESAAQVVEDNVGAFVRTAYTRSSVSVHTEPVRKDAVSILRFVELALLELLGVDG